MRRVRLWIWIALGFVLVLGMGTVGVFYLCGEHKDLGGDRAYGRRPTGR
jgi:hypothetical protein